MKLLRKRYLSIDMGKSSCKIIEAELKPELRIISHGLYPIRKLSKSNFKARDAVISFHDPSVIIRELQLPNADENDLSSIIHNEVAEYFPEIYKDYETSYRSTIDKENPNLSYVTLAACPKAVVQSYINTIQNSGIKVKIIDAQVNSAFKLVDFLFSHTADLNKDHGYLLADIGYSNISISVIGQGRILCYKVLGYGTGYLSINGQGVNEFINKLSIECSRLIEFFLMSGYRIPLKQGLIYGGGVHMPSIIKELEDNTGLVIDDMDSFRRFIAGLPAEMDLNIYTNCIGALLRRDDAL